MRWVGGEFRLRIDVPAGMEPAEGDATAFMLLALPLAMYRGEDLQLDGLVSPLTLRQSERLQTIYAAWDRAAIRSRVRVAGELPSQKPASGHGCLFSRGVDSMYSAIDTSVSAETQLVFCDSLEPIQDAQTRAEEWRLVQEAAGLIGRGVMRISTNLRSPEAQLIDYQDLHGAGIAFMGHSLSGGFGEMVVPADQSYSIAGASGSNPLINPLFASDRLTFDYHGLEAGRPGKVARLASERPDLLPYLKVCFMENTPANCGRCRKCLVTMIALQSAGALELASLFPDRIDLEVLRAVRIEEMTLRFFFAEALERLGDSEADRRVRAGVEHVLRRSARPTPLARARTLRAWLRGERERAGADWSQAPSRQYRSSTNAAVALMKKGMHIAYGVEASSPQPQPAWSIGPLEPDWAPPSRPSAAQVGLMRLLDRRARRHRYAVGVIPPLAGTERVGELGALWREGAPGRVPVWVSAQGRVRTDRYEPLPPRRSWRVLARWTLAPLRWRDLGTLSQRLEEVLRRTVDGGSAFAGRGQEDELRLIGSPLGYLSSQPGPGRLELLSAIHPITGDQLLTTDWKESARLGYNAPESIGFLEDAAPASGTLLDGRPTIAWASRFGQGKDSAAS
jgi:hypothetical protein